MLFKIKMRFIPFLLNVAIPIITKTPLISLAFRSFSSYEQVFRANGSLKRPNLPEHCVPQILKHKAPDTKPHIHPATRGHTQTHCQCHLCGFTPNQSRSYHLYITWIHQMSFINTNRHCYIKPIKRMFFYYNNSNKHNTYKNNSIYTIKQSNLNLNHEYKTTLIYKSNLK